MTPVCHVCGHQLTQWRPTIYTLDGPVQLGKEMTYCSICNVERVETAAAAAQPGDKAVRGERHGSKF